MDTFFRWVNGESLICFLRKYYFPAILFISFRTVHILKLNLKFGELLQSPILILKLFIKSYFYYRHDKGKFDAYVPFYHSFCIFFDNMSLLFLTQSGRTTWKYVFATFWELLNRNILLFIFNLINLPIDLAFINFFGCLHLFIIKQTFLFDLLNESFLSITFVLFLFQYKFNKKFKINNILFYI